MLKTFLLIYSKNLENMKYSKAQQFLSIFLIFLVLFSITFKIPLLNYSTFAGNNDFYDLVSIIVDEETYDEVKSEINRYASDIQTVLNNTRAVIIPMPVDTTSFEVASLNEDLYFTWYKSLKNVNFESKLVWTVLIWNFNLPQVYKNGAFSRTILPFTDFENKSYIYNHITNKYEYNTDSLWDLNPEIWHWVISPNTWDFDRDIKSLENYFEKNNDYYQWTWNFQLSQWILNWKEADNIPDNYEPFVFYFDVFRENQSINYSNYIWYKWYLENKEDLVYNRYTKELAEKLKSEITWVTQEGIYDLAKKVDPNIDIESLKEDSNLDNISDIQTRYISDNVVNKFIEIFSNGSLWELRKDVHNAWRYNNWLNVWVDFAPYLISVLDIVNDEIVKEINDDLEHEIDEIVKNWLSRKIPTLNTFTKWTVDWWSEIYKNLLYWKKTEDISKAEQCSIYRWSLTNSWKLVESNRWYNINNIDADKIKLWNDYWEEEDFFCRKVDNMKEGKSYIWRWWWNTPFNLNKEKITNWKIALYSYEDWKNHLYPYEKSLSKSIVSLFDIAWSTEIKDDIKILSPLDCTDTNLILMQQEVLEPVSWWWDDWVEFELVTKFRSPIFWKSINWNCTTWATTYGSWTYDFETLYKDSNWLGCSYDYVKNWYDITKNYKHLVTTWTWANEKEECLVYKTDNWKFKEIPSDIEHKSPTAEEITTQIDAKVTPDLPVDKDRYIDFISAKWNYTKINYPYLFRVENQVWDNFDMEKAKEILDEYLDDKSKEINNIITINQPNFSWKDLEIYNLLKTWDYPQANLNLKQIIKDKWNTTLELWWEQKIVSYYDILVFSIYWNNLNTVSSKYGFVFDNYLSDQTDSEDLFFLPKNKKQYEVAYLWAKWDAQNMYIWVEPEKKAENPYSDIISANQELDSNIYSSNIATNNRHWDSTFECAPPEWVPLWEWIPAIFCRLWNMMPPTISIWQWQCWTTFLTNDEKEEIAICNDDVNKNGVNDCLEKNLTDSTLELSSDSSRYNYLKYAELESKVLDQNWNLIKIISSTDIKFYVEKIEEIKNGKPVLVYDKNSDLINDIDILDTYISFKEQEIRADWWKANYWFSTKSIDSNIYLKSSINLNDSNDTNLISLDSNTLKIEVREDRLFISSSTFIKDDLSKNWYQKFIWKSWIEANDLTNVYLIDWNQSSTLELESQILSTSKVSESLILELNNISKNWNQNKISYPLDITLFDSNWKIIQNTILNNIDKFKGIYNLEKSWTYTLSILDFIWNKIDKKINIYPTVESKLDLHLWTNILEKWWVVTTNFVTVYDEYDNVVSWKLFDFDLSLDNQGLEFVDNEKQNFISESIEWYKIFRLKSTDEIWEHNLKVILRNDDWEEVLETSKKIDVLKEIKIITWNPNQTLKVWWNEYSQKISLRDEKWNILTNFNSRVYLIVDPIYLESTKPYFDIINWEGEIKFITKTLAWEDIPLEFQVEWLNEIIAKTITINPEKAIKMDLTLSKTEMEADSIEKSTLFVELKDRYNNLVFTDNSTKTNLSIDKKYLSIIMPEWYSEVVSKWVSKFILHSTKTPGLAYFKVSTNPNLALNSFTIEDESWDFVVSWVWENAGFIETFYLWNKDKIDWNSYNSIYTTLLWANYWDIEQENYLAWSLLFDRDNRALAVTSLLNNPINTNNIISVSKKWEISTVSSWNDLSQDIVYSVAFEKNKLFLNVFNESLSTYIWKIYYNLAEKNNLEICTWKFSECLSKEETSIWIKSLSSWYKALYEDDKIVFRNEYWETYLEILENWEIIRKSNIEFELNDSLNNWYLSINLKIWENIIWELVVSLVWWKINTSRDIDLFKNKKTTLKNSILILLASKSYWSLNNWKWEDSLNVIYYVDPFADKNTLDTFSKGNNYSYENFIDQKWVGWSDYNKTLLAFSAWESVWNSLKNNMSFSAINLWDPVISLKKIKKKLPTTTNDREFDSTLWTLLSNDESVKNYRVFDYNKDWYKDIILTKNNNYIEILENIEWKYTNKWNLAYIADLWNKDLVKTWDFTWDWYWDIFYVNNKWKPYLLNNTIKDFNIYPLKWTLELSGKIIKAETFDMDHDWTTDIVTLDENWELNIFYWKWTSKKPTFEKNTLADDYWIVLDTSVRKDNSLIYHWDIYQLDWKSYLNDLNKQSEEYIKDLDSHLNDLNKQSEEYIKGLENKISSQSDDFKSNNKVNTDLLNNLMFEKIAYSDAESTDISLDNLIESSNDYNVSKTKTFIKSEYSEHAWVKIEKQYSDENEGFLKSWEKVNVEVTLKNISWKRLDNVVFLEKIESVFTLDEDSITNSKDLEARDPNNYYSFLIDGFWLDSNQEFKINYTLTVRPLNYGYLEVWLFETGELWDDVYWDVVIKSDNKNCSNPVDMYRSIGQKAYTKTLKEPICDENSIKLPEELEKNSFDSDWNGVPDYIDDLLTDDAKAKEYAEEQLSKSYNDSDKDWIPDNEDSYSNQNAILSSLTTIDEDIDAWLDEIQDFVNGLSCWFNNGGCISTPLNWAPLAPGWDPTAFGYPIWDWLNIGEWLPVFSALTWNQTMCWNSPCCLPTVFPASAKWFIPWPLCWPDSAWWSKWIRNPTNFFRFFITPTLTWGVWTAACFWWPAMVAWYENMPWISPIFPWWNCIVLTKPLIWCSADWSEGDVWATWNVTYNWSFWIINWNCWVQEDEKQIDDDYAETYYEYLNWNISDDDFENSDWALWQTWKWWWDWALFTLNWASWDEVSVTFDSDSFEVDFSDVEEIYNERTKAFPNFLMDWVTRQIEEIKSKLTDFPTIFVIMPDFSGIFDWWWYENSWNADDDFDLLSTWWELDWIDTSEMENETLKGAADSINWAIDSVKNSETTKRVNSWIKETYEFLASVPLVKMQQEKVNITIPWISIPEIDKTIVLRKATLQQRQDEFNRATDAWSLWTTCDEWDTKCEEENKLNISAQLKISWLIDSIQKNIEVLEGYKELPEDIYEFLNKKEDYLEQILCNIETISKLVWWRIWKNWERFKAWIQTYILIKAILKSWQLFIDVFIDYEESCKECKNERNDLQTFTWELIDMVIPEIPVIQFPKWPDIIIDLHDIRAWLTIQLPEYEINTKPILLPELPYLYLPDVPSINLAAEIKLPDLPILPSIELPELPDLPSLPTVELPDLPPPPTLPKLIWEISWVLDILKLVTKAMCILKSSPFVPEWRAWDQIAYLTERSWYLSTDFWDLNMPQFSLPFIDAIEVKTHVNLEFQVDFIVEMARQVAMPINSFNADFTNIFHIPSDALDYRHIVPSEINIDVNADYSGDSDWAVNIDSNLESNNNMLLFVWLVSNGIKQLYNYIDINKETEVTSKELQKIVLKELASKSITSDPNLEELSLTWNNVWNYSFSKEEKLINELKEVNSQKFEIVENILNTEIIKNKNQIEKVKKLYNGNSIIKIWLNDNSAIWKYNESLEKYNKIFEQKAKALVNPDKTIENEIKEVWDDLMNEVNDLFTYDSTQNLFAADVVNSSTVNANLCSAKWTWNYEYQYKWIYIIEDNISYRLFDYLDELRGDEIITTLDVDNDSDEDVLYMANESLYLKTNIKVQDNKKSISEAPLVLNINDNKYFSWDVFYESVNNINEYWVWDWITSISFNWNTSWKINSYRLEFYQIVDKFKNLGNSYYVPKNIKKIIYDWVSDLDNHTLIEEKELYTTRQNLVNIQNVWDLNWVELTTTELIDINIDILNNKVVNVTPWTKIYAWKNTVKLQYQNQNEEIGEITIQKWLNIEINNAIKIIWTNTSAYIDSWNQIKYIWEEIREMIKKPLLFDSVIKFVWSDNSVKDDSYIELLYFDWSELSLDFDEIKEWNLYNLGFKSNSYSIPLYLKNDYYYWKIKIFNEDIIWTESKQILLSPQSSADDSSPILNLPSIKIPVYQKEIIDITPYIYETSWIKNSYIDFDLDLDSSWDWIKNNDNDSDLMENIKNYDSSWHLRFEFWEFWELLDKEISIILEDDNGNISYNEVNFQVYSLTPSIKNVSWNKITGSINENLTDEPINIYRYRWWWLTKLLNHSGAYISNTQDWKYDFWIDNDWNWLVLSQDSKEVWYIDEYTWKITITDLNFNYDVYSSNSEKNDLGYVKILIVNNENKLFYQAMKVEWLSKVKVVDEFSIDLEKWIYLNFENKSNYNYYSIPENAPYNPWSVSIYRISDLDKQPLFTIFKDWRIYITDNRYWLEYESYENYVVIKLIDKNLNKEVANVMYIIEAEYIIK